MNRIVLTSGALIAVLLAAPALIADDKDKENEDEGERNFRFEFALIGDNPYAPTTGVLPNKKQVYPPPMYLNLINDLNKNKLEFVVHAGDIKAGDTWCSDDVYANNLELFNTFKAPVIYLPGDNEWTDCHRANNGGFNPLERLALLRTKFYPTDRSLGKHTIRLKRQSEDPKYSLYRENVMWNIGTALFVGINMPGSNNNRGRTTPPFVDGDVEYAARNAANIAWINKAFDLAAADRTIKGVMIIAQANPFERFLEAVTPPYPASGYADFISTLRARTVAYGKPVVYVNGDTHYFRIDKPLTETYPGLGVATPGGARIYNFTRVEVFAQGDVHWVKVRVDPHDPNLFSLEPCIVPENAPH